MRVVVLASGLLCAFALVAGGQPPADAPAIAAAKQREQAVRTVAIEFRLTEDIAEGGISAKISAFPGAKAKKTLAQATKLESTNRLVISGNNTRYENNHPLWGFDTGKLSRVSSINTMNESFNKTFFPVGLSKPERGEGTIGRTAQSDAIKAVTLTPVTIWFRGLQRSITPYLLTDFRPAGRASTINGKECEEYAQSGNQSAGTFFWFDPKSGYTLRRIRTNWKGKPQDQCDIEYRLDASGVWVPTSWVRNEFADNGQVSLTARVDVISIQLNAEYPATDFDMNFPPGADVYNAKENKHYLVQENGTMREFSVLTGEFSDETVYQLGAPWLERYLWWVVGAALVIVLVIAVGLGRRKRV